MHELALHLNRTIQGTILDSLLSETGRRLYFPKGIVLQAQQASQRAPRFNATAGIARNKDGPFILDSLYSPINALTTTECVDYAPTGGDQRLRRLWKKELSEKNPSLENLQIGLPLVTAGITHGVSLAADLFVDPGDIIIMPEPSWENYELIFKDKKEAQIISYPFFSPAGRFNTDALGQTLARIRLGDKAVVILNFPHNPTGYTPDTGEAADLIHLLLEAAVAGKKLLVILDDSYFGLLYKDGLMKESLFASLADLHENIAALKLDGATKEYFAWGLRIGFFTLAARGLKDCHYEALQEKALGAIRTSVSSASRLSQSLLIRVLENPGRLEEKRIAFEILKRRYQKVKNILSKTSSPHLIPLPFNSGYFLLFETHGIDADDLRVFLLEKKGIGCVALTSGLLRIAYSCVPEEEMGDFFREIFLAAETLAKKE